MMLLPQTVGKSVIRNQNHSWWESCPPLFENALSKIFFPEILPYGSDGVSVADFRRERTQV